MPVPTPETIRTWRLGLLPLCDLVSAIKIANSKTLTIHPDATAKRQKKLACAVIDTDEGYAMAGGVYSQKGGTAKETAQLVFSAGFETPQATLESARGYMIEEEEKVVRQGERSKSKSPSGRLGSSSKVPVRKRPELVDFIPDKDIVGLLVSGQVPVTMQQDHAASANLS